jgi:hypothetical protein
MKRRFRTLAVFGALVGLLVFAVPVLDRAVEGSSAYNGDAYTLVSSVTTTLGELFPFLVLVVAGAVVLVGIRGVF